MLAFFISFSASVIFSPIDEDVDMVTEAIESLKQSGREWCRRTAAAVGGQTPFHPPFSCMCSKSTFEYVQHM
jgi:hypothetical protein